MFKLRNKVVSRPEGPNAPDTSIVLDTLFEFDKILSDDKNDVQAFIESIRSSNPIEYNYMEALILIALARSHPVALVKRIKKASPGERFVLLKKTIDKAMPSWCGNILQHTKFFYLGTGLSKLPVIHIAARHPEYVPQLMELLPVHERKEMLLFKNGHGMPIFYILAGTDTDPDAQALLEALTKLPENEIKEVLEANHGGETIFHQLADRPKALLECRNLLANTRKASDSTNKGYSNFLSAIKEKNDSNLVEQPSKIKDSSQTATSAFFRDGQQPAAKTAGSDTPEKISNFRPGGPLA